MISGHLILETTGRYLIAWTWQVAIVVILGWSATLVDRAHRPALRRRIWTLTVTCILLTPWLPPILASLPWTHQVRAFMIATPRPSLLFRVWAKPFEPANPSDAGALQLSTGLMAGLEAADHGRNATGNALFSWIATVWLAGIAVGLFLRLRILARVRRYLMNAERSSIEALTSSDHDWSWLRGDSPRILLSPAIQNPMVVGWFRPAILAPKDIEQWSTVDERAAILRHECVHVLRKDHWLSLVEAMVRVALFFHPLARFACRRLNIEREMSCDQEVLRFGSDAEAYAETILKVAERIVSARVACDGVFFASANLLDRRIQMLFRPDPRKSRRSLILFPVSTMLALLFALSLLHVEADPLLSAPVSLEIRVSATPAAEPPQVMSPRSVPSTLATARQVRTGTPGSTSAAQEKGSDSPQRLDERVMAPSIIHKEPLEYTPEDSSSKSIRNGDSGHYRQTGWFFASRTDRQDHRPLRSGLR